MKFAQNIHPTRLFGPTFFMKFAQNIHPTRLIGTWEYTNQILKINKVKLFWEGHKIWKKSPT